MVRAVRFASRLGFRIEPDTNRAILRHHRELEKGSPARLIEEIYRLFGFRSGEAAFRLLRQTQLLSVLFPEIDIYLDEYGDDAPLWRYLDALDKDEATGEMPSPSMIFGSLYYDLIDRCEAEARPTGERLVYADLVATGDARLGEVARSWRTRSARPDQS